MIIASSEVADFRNLFKDSTLVQISRICNVVINYRFTQVTMVILRLLGFVMIFYLMVIAFRDALSD